MKKATLVTQVNVPDTFVCGDCKWCPLSCKSYFDNYYAESRVSCKLGYTPPTCPLQLEEKRGDHEGEISRKEIF